MRVINVMGREVDLDVIQNPKLKRVVERRFRDRWMFNYGDTDHTEHTESQKSYDDKYGDSWKIWEKLGEIVTPSKGKYEHNQHVDRF